MFISLVIQQETCAFLKCVVDLIYYKIMKDSRFTVDF